MPNTDQVKSNAAAIGRLAEAQAEFRGQVAQFMENQDKVNERLTEVVTNHLPHISSRIGRLEGKFIVVLWALGAVASLIVAVGALNAFA